MINFKKETIFGKGNKQNIKQDEVVGGVLCVWGSPSSGKSTVASKIAKYLSDKKQDVVLVLCDMTAPMLPCILPKTEIETEKSLGSILAATHVTEALIKYNMITLKRNSNLTILAMLKGENEYTYAPYSKIQAEELIENLREIAPFVIIDCSSYIANDILSAVSLMESDYVLRLVNCDLKSISYLSSQLPLLQVSNFDTEKQYKIASNIKPNQGTQQMAGAMGSLAFKIPYSSEVEEQFLSGNLLDDLILKNSKEFKGEIKKICREVFGI